MRKNWTKGIWGLLAVCSLSLMACGSSDDKTPLVTDGDGESETVDGDQTDTAEGESEAEAPSSDLRVYLIPAGEKSPVTGPAAVGMAGDYVLENTKARFVIQGAVRPRSWVPYGGTLVDADLKRADGEAGKDILNEMSIITGTIRGFMPDSFEIVKDGSDKTSAVLRVKGHDIGIPVVDMVLPLAPFKAKVVLEYELLPNDTALKLTTYFTASQRGSVRLGDGVVWNRHTMALTPSVGWDTDKLSGETFDEQYATIPGLACGFAPAEGQLTGSISSANMVPYMGFYKKLVNPGETVSYTRYFVVGQDLEAVRAVLAEKRKSAARSTLTVNMSVADAANDAAAQAEVLVLDAKDIPVAQAYLPATKLSFALAPGDYKVTTSQQGRPAATPVAVTIAAEAKTIDLQLPATGRVSYKIGGDGFDKTTKEGLPCRISIQTGADAANEAEILRREFTATGTGEFLLEPGAYTLIASRGYEYEIYKTNITVTAGQVTNVEGLLTRSVDSTGWVAADLHMHSSNSIDAWTVPEKRVVELAAVGLERMPNTEHDFVSSMDDLAKTMGVDSWIRLSAGCEVSPPGYHTNGYPMVDDMTRPAYFGARWYKGYDPDGKFLGAMTFPEIWEEMRSVYKAGIVQINHPRDGQGYLNKIQYDPVKGVDALEPGVFSADFDTIELINAARTDIALEKGLADYYSFLNQGIEAAAVGVSDSHVDSDPGDARTYLRTGEDDPRAIDDDAFVAVLKAKRSVAASGPFIEAKIGEAQIGDTYKGAGPYTLHVKVQAPTWMPLDWVRVIVNGTQVVEKPITLTAGGLRFDEDIALDSPGKDFWVVVLAGAPDKRMAPVSPQQPVLSITSPIFVDVDSNGYTKPGLPPIVNKR